MQIIKPYGRSFTETNQRVLLDKHRDKHDIPPFAASHEKLVIAQWVSVIDKIVRKPNPKAKISLPTPQQYQLRETLGNAAWLELNKRLPCSDHAVFWRSKIHPYGHATQEQEPAPLLQGRWYQRFVGDIEPTAITENVAQIIAERIASHLYEAELRLSPEAEPRGKGKIQAQAESIEKNTLHQPKLSATWCDADWTAYNRHDVAERIYLEAKFRLEQKQEACKNKQPMQLEWRIDRSLTGKILFEHWAKVYSGTDGKSRITEAKQEKPGLFHLHMAVKDFYTRLFDSDRRDETLVEFLLPRKKKALREKLEQKSKNTDLAASIRLGKILYYREAESETVPLANSRFWGSDGQAEIKRAEAFVRVWRHVLGQSNLTLANWASLASPDELWEKDSFDSKFLDHVEKLFAKDNGLDKRRQEFDQNLNLLLGDGASAFMADDDSRQAAIRLAYDVGSALRHAAFHFKGRDKFLEVLDKDLSDKGQASGLLLPLNKLLATAQEKQDERLLATLEGAHVFQVCTQAQVQQLVNSICAIPTGDLPLPRFGRVIERNHNAGLKTGLPSRVNRQAMEQNPAQKCQYVVLKMLYERPFRVWLEGATDAMLSTWLTTALNRSTTAARNNPDVSRKPQDERELVTARAAKLPIAIGGKDGQSKNKSIRQFFHDLSAATASEMRVQRGYASDAEKAREQAEYIDELLRDVVALAFKDFLDGKGLCWLLDIDPKQTLQPIRCCPTENIQLPARALQIVNWQPVLYFLLHLMPVGEVSQLLHQLAKWEILAKPEQARNDTEGTRIKALQHTLKLYLDMHDSQYTGDDAMPTVERDVLTAFSSFYENPRVFAQVFENQGNGRERAQYLPQRGLREIRRFGHTPVLQTLVKKKITAEDVSRCLTAEAPLKNGIFSVVAEAQSQREALHAQWVKERKQFEGYQGYAAALKKVVAHRQDSNHIRLVDHVAAHRIVMKVLARLADFSGLFERDLTFVTLATLHEHGLQKADFFKVGGLRKFDNGQIIEALSSGVQAVRQSIKDEINTHCAFDAHKKIRNDLAHFNMLHSDNGLLNTPLNLTHWVNQIRTLMSYDRKLKNAVSQSIMELLEREGFILTWEMNSHHQLCNATLESRVVHHLGDKKFPLKEDKRAFCRITESLHSDAFVRMLAVAFGGAAHPNQDIGTLDLQTVNWEGAKAKWAGSQ